jgi:cytochrome c6
MKTTTLAKITVSAVLLTTLLTGRALAADAKENWENNCAKCHGADGKGQTKMGRQLGVKDYTDAKVQGEMKDDQMLQRTKEGLKEGSKEKMPAYKEKLSEQEIKDLIALVRGFKK